MFKSPTAYRPLFVVLLGIFLYSLPTVALEPAYDTSFLAQGTSEFVVPIKKWGRISFQIENPQGTHLELIDRKVGHRASDGVSGEVNGRIDEYLDKGEYKLITTSSSTGTETAKLRAYNYTELNIGNPQYLRRLKSYVGELKDLQQASYWLHIEKDTTIFFEALGRYVDDVQIWEDGEWRVNISKKRIKSTPTPEEPLKGYRVVQKLSPGYYQITIYGGKPVDWATNSTAAPYYLNVGVPRIGAASMGNYTISAKGYDYFTVEPSMSRAVLSLPKKENVKLSSFGYSGSVDFYNEGSSDIHDKSREPRCIIKPRSRNNYHIVEVRGTPGQAYTLQTFVNTKSTYYVPENGNYWLSTIHSGFPQDQIGVSGGISSGRNHSILELNADTISGNHDILRRFNLVEKMTSYVWVAQPGKYLFNTGTSEVEITLERFFLDKQNKRVARFNTKKKLPLERGLYKMTLRPKQKGIAYLSIKKSSLVGAVVDFVTGDDTNYDRVRATLQYPSVAMSKNQSYNFFVNSLNPEIWSLVYRKLPINPEEPLPVYLKQKGSEKVSIRITEKSQLLFRDAKGKQHTLLIDGKKVYTPYVINPGTYSITMSATNLGYYSLQAIPLQQLPTSKPTPFPTGSNSPLPRLSSLTPGKQVFYDLERNDQKTFEFTVTEPGIYQFETTGRLKTAITIRDRFITSLARQSANGTGRNARMISYLLPGLYRTNIETQGQSTGKLGIKLKLQEKLDGGDLTTEREKRHEVQAGKSISYNVIISDSGFYHIESQGQQGYFNVRLDDADGWPLIKPSSSGLVKKKLPAGEYQFISLPKQQKRLRIGRVSKIEDQASYMGKGPHTLVVNQGASSIWSEERDTEGNRLPARYTIDITAPAPFSCQISSGLTAKLINLDADQIVSSWSGSANLSLEKGSYAIEVLADKESNHKEYSLSFTTGYLIPGLSYYVSPTAWKTVSVGEQSVVELYSQGMEDVQATLYDESKSSKVAWNDDGTNDWNFKISQVLAPGTYQLKVEGVGGYGNSSNIRMSALKDTTHKDWPLNTNKPLNLKGKIHTMEVPAQTGDEVLHCAISGKSGVGVLIERLDKLGWHPVGRNEGLSPQLTTPMREGEKYRVSIWSTDHLNENTDVSINHFPVRLITINELKRGVSARTFQAGDKQVLFYKVDMKADSLNHYRIKSTRSANLLALYTTDQDDRSLTVDPDETLFSSLRRFNWIAAVYDSKGKNQLKADPIILSEPQNFQLAQTPRAFSIPPEKESVVLLHAKMKNGTPQWGTPIKNGSQFAPAQVPVQAGISYNGHEALTALTANETPQVVLWNALQERSTLAEQVFLSKEIHEISKKDTLRYASWNQTVEANKVTQLILEEKEGAQIRLSLPAHSVALWKSEQGHKKVFVAHADLVPVEIIDNSGTLFLISRSKAVSVHIECQALPKNFDVQSQSFTKNGQYEQYFNAPGAVAINTDITTKELDRAQIYYSGTISDVTWWSSAGRMHDKIPTGFSIHKSDIASVSRPGGMVVINHGIGWVKLNISNKEKPLALWGSTKISSGKETLTRPQVSVIAKDTTWFEIKLDKEQHLRLQSQEDLVGALVEGDKVIKSYIGMNGFDVDFPLQKGTYRLGLRGLNGQKISGAILQTSFYDMAFLSEETPVDLDFAPGQSRMVQFKVAERKQIGIGIATEREVVEVELYDSNLQLVDRGQQQFIKLDGGTYYLRLRVAETSPSTTCQVRLFGQKPPTDEPPATLIEKFQQLSE